jgi:hypothetical protein
VFATTGGLGPTPALYRVDSKIAALYPGQYVMQSAANGARLFHGQMVIHINSLGYLQGAAQFAGYDPQGHRTTWVAVLYNFRLTAPNTMAIGVYGPLGSPLFGWLYVHRTPRGDLVGEVALPKPRYAIWWHKNFAL